MFLTGSVSSNDIDITFDGIDLFEGLHTLADFFSDIPNKLPSYARVGSLFGTMLEVFPPKFWFTMIIVVICLTIARIFKRY